MVTLFFRNSPSSKFVDSRGAIITVLVILVLGVLVVGVGMFLFKNKFSSPITPLTSQKQELIKFKTGLTLGAAVETQGLIIKKYEIDKKYGIDIEYVPTNPGDLERELIERKYPMAMTGVLAAYEHVRKGNNLKIVFPVIHFSYDIITPVESSIKTIADLKGKKFGILSKTTAAYPGAFLVLKSTGLDPEKDLKLVFGTPPEVVQAINDKEVEAAITAYPLAAGLLSTGKFKSIVKLENVWKEYEDGLPMPFVSMIAHEDWWNTNKETAQKIMKIYHEAALMMQQDPSIIDGLTDYLKNNKIDSPDSMEIVRAQVPGLLFEKYGEDEYQGMIRYYERAKSLGFLDPGVPAAESIIIKPSELQF